MIMGPVCQPNLLPIAAAADADAVWRDAFVIGECFVDTAVILRALMGTEDDRVDAVGEGDFRQLCADIPHTLQLIAHGYVG